ncbi:MAG TPA: 5-oxoprolinase subunit PxpA [Fimbriimonadaceae bacterium]|nr:5-oxoprolinase subunit PxpA [Fimbriimonadaceae bacterium]
MKRIDLNVDIGEGFPVDAELLQFATSANVCCGVHAGSSELTGKTVELAKRLRVRVGAHPGFPDRESMGRRRPSEAEVRQFAPSLMEQIAEFPEPTYVKPHGAFYNLLFETQSPESDLAREVVHEFSRQGFALMLLPIGWALDHQIRLIREGFADRAYLPDGRLTPRSLPGAVLHDPEQIKRQVLELATTVDSICLHGDAPNCLEFAELVHKTLLDAGYEIGF